MPETIRQKLETDLAFSAVAGSFGATVRVVPEDEIDLRLSEITTSLGLLTEAAMAPGYSPVGDTAMVAAAPQGIGQ